MKIYNYFKNIPEENSQEFILKNIDETRHYSVEEINRDMNWWVRSTKKFVQL